MSSNLPIAATKQALERPEVLATFFQALADPTRVRILELLAERAMTVSELVSALGLAQGRVSSHLTCLRWCGYVRAEVDVEREVVVTRCHIARQALCGRGSGQDGDTSCDEGGESGEAAHGTIISKCCFRSS